MEELKRKWQEFSDAVLNYTGELFDCKDAEISLVTAMNVIADVLVCNDTKGE